MEQTAAGRGPSDSGPGARAALRETGPQSPLFTARVDDVRGTVRIRGHLDGLGAEEVAATVERLAEAGHARVTVEIGALATADVSAIRLLGRVAARLATHQVALTLA